MEQPDDILNMLDTFCPMHVVLDADGRIAHCGATFAKLCSGGTAIGQSFLEICEILRPRSVSDMDELMTLAGQKLSLRFLGRRATALKGVLASVGDGAVVNLSFGIAIMDGVRDFSLSGSDFAATDLAIEMLYLIEAKSAAMEASRKLNLRLQGAKIAAEERSFTDTLTGLKNRRAVEQVLPRLIGRGAAFSLLQLDLDYFKSVNDTYGHPAGDHVLQQVARILIEETRRGDCVARVGGDEFVIILEALIDKAALARIATRIITQIEEPILYRGDTCKISASIGIASSGPGQSEKGDILFARADKALYEAKNAGRAQFRVAE